MSLVDSAPVENCPDVSAVQAVAEVEVPRRTLNPNAQAWKGPNHGAENQAEDDGKLEDALAQQLESEIASMIFNPFSVEQFAVQQMAIQQAMLTQQVMQQNTAQQYMLQQAVQQMVVQQAAALQLAGQQAAAADGTAATPPPVIIMPVLCPMPMTPNYGALGIPGVELPEHANSQPFGGWQPRNQGSRFKPRNQGGAYRPHRRGTPQAYAQNKPKSNYPWAAKQKPPPAAKPQEPPATDGWHRKTNLLMPEDKDAVSPHDPTAILYAISDPSCSHPAPWRKLRTKRGFLYFICNDCGARWRTEGKVIPYSNPNYTAYARGAVRNRVPAGKPDWGWDQPTSSTFGAPKGTEEADAPLVSPLDDDGNFLGLQEMVADLEE